MVNRKRIAVVAGGDSSEYGISIKSAQVVMRNLQSRYKVFLVEMREGKWTCTIDHVPIPVNKNDFTVSVHGEKIAFDGVFIAIHGSPGEDGKLQGYFDMLGIKYSTAGVLPLALTFNKGYCNSYLKQQGVKCAENVQLHAQMPYDGKEIMAQLGLPCFVKPNQAGSSYGVSKVNHPEDFEQAVEDAFVHDDQVLVESFLNGREITCGVHDLHSDITALPPTEIVTDNDFFDFEAKYEGASNEITPAQIPAATTTAIQEAAKNIYRLVGLKGVARVDFILHNNEPYMIEVNTVPGLSDESLIPQQAVAAGYTLPEFFSLWVEKTLF